MKREQPCTLAQTMTSRISLPEDYVHYLDGLVRGSERRLAPLVRALSDRYVGKTEDAGTSSSRRAAWRSAYTAYYGPVNALKLQAIAAELAGRSTVLSRWSSARSSSAPRLVMGVFGMSGSHRSV